MTVHRLYSWRWWPHPWLRFVLPWRVKENSARVLDAVKPDVMHFQSHIVVGRGSGRGREARHPPRRNQPLHAREHARVHAAAQRMQDWPRDGLEGGRRTSGRPTPSPRRRAGPRSSSRSTPACRRARHLVRHRRPQLHARTSSRHREPHPLRRPRQRREAHRRAARALALLPPSSTPSSRSSATATSSATSSTSRPSSASPTASPSPARHRRGAARGLPPATVFAMPSIAELQSIVTMEAMASACRSSPPTRWRCRTSCTTARTATSSSRRARRPRRPSCSRCSRLARGVPRAQGGVDPADRRARHQPHALDIREPVSWKPVTDPVTDVAPAATCPSDAARGAVAQPVRAVDS